MSNPGIFQSLLLGARKSAESSKAANEAYPSVLNLASPYKKELASRGVSFKETPLQAVGAMAARIATDITNDGTRGVYWRYNHPLAILEKGIEKLRLQAPQKGIVLNHSKKSTFPLLYGHVAEWSKALCSGHSLFVSASS